LDFEDLLFSNSLLEAILIKFQGFLLSGESGSHARLISYSLYLLLLRPDIIRMRTKVPDGRNNQEPVISSSSDSIGLLLNDSWDTK
jgi:hypothetical protein